MTHQSGVLPDPVIRDPRSEAAFIFLTLDPKLKTAAAKAALIDLRHVIAGFVGPSRRRLGSAALGFGRSFFLARGKPRVDFAQGMPVGLGSVPRVDAPGLPRRPDIAVYAMSPQESRLADLLRAISGLRGRGVVGAHVERGFQTADGRELFGNLDGLRNVPKPERRRTIFIDRDRQTKEPEWAEDGTYLAYLKIRQHFDAWDGLAEDQKERIIGRRLADGSRLDLPGGTNPHREPDFTGRTPSPSSHVRKSGPRGEHDDVAIFRRGVPYFGLGPDGSPLGGLQFVSFQASLDQFDVIYNEWISDEDFPKPNTGVDRLLGRGLVTIERAAFFFVPPRDDRFPGAGAFDPPRG